MLARCRLPTVSPKADTVTFSVALGVLGECLGESEDIANNIDPYMPIETPDGHVEDETNKIASANYFQHHTCESITSKYSITKKLAEGSFSVAFLGEHKATKSLRCIKKSTQRGNGLTNKALLNEIEILKTLDHPNIVKVYESMEAGNNLYLAMEYCDGGDLCDLVLQTQEQHELLSEAYIARIMKQVVQAVAYLHSRNILHKDLKLENVVLDKTKNNAKLIDFGISEQLTGVNGKSVCEGGTDSYSSPEGIDAIKTVRQNDPAKIKLELKAGVTLKADIWSLGIMIYVLATGRCPFDKADLLAEQLPAIPVTERYNSYSEELRDLVGKMLKHDPNERPSAEECLQHPFFKDVPDEEIDVVEEQTILDTLK